MRRSLLMIVLLLVVSIGSSSAAGDMVTALDYQSHLGPYESYFDYIGNYPHFEITPYSEKLQGVTNDNDFWYITQIRDLWKYPVGVYLADPPDPSPTNGILHAEYDDVAGYEHLGDLDYHQGYLFVPLEEKDGYPNGLGVFRASDLAFLGYDEMGGDGSWLAVDPRDGSIYKAASWNSSNRLTRIVLDWNKLAQNPPVVQILSTQNVNLYNLGVGGRDLLGSRRRAGSLYPRAASRPAVVCDRRAGLRLPLLPALFRSSLCKRSFYSRWRGWELCLPLSPGIFSGDQGLVGVDD
ncbi:MAG: hypothetical protein P8074_23100 [Anaerolineales bacterium]